MTIFSDGLDYELKEILELDQTNRFHNQNDLVDVITLSKSKILMTTKESSYSYWAAFLSDGAVLHHPETWVTQCRDQKTNEIVFDGLINTSEALPDLLLETIKTIA